MGLATTFFMALGLSMDAFAASISDGARAPRLRQAYALRVAPTFAAFQAGMPLIGWAVGQGFAAIIQSVDHWIAFGLLGVIGARMIHADLRPKAPGVPATDALPHGWRTLLIVAVATSIDALVVGFSLTFVGSILVVAAVIGLVTFAMCLVGINIGHRYRHLAQGKVQALGGSSSSGSGRRSLWSTWA